MSDKVVLSNCAVAFLRREGRYLLMKRSSEKEVAPNVWSGIGGKFEPLECNDPMSACLREIYEETGISKEHVCNLELRYIIIRRAKDTLRQSYVYFGETDRTELTDTEEGTLHWIPEEELLNREFTKTYEAMLRHFMDTPDEKGRIVVGIAENMDGELHMNWSILEDF